MASRLERKMHGYSIPSRIVLAPAEQLPFASESFDCVVSTLVLCTVQEMLFERQHEWADLHGQPAAFERPPARASFDHYASSLELDMNKLRESVAHIRHQEKVARDMRDGESLGVKKTPSFFVNGRMLMQFSVEDFRRLVTEQLSR